MNIANVRAIPAERNTYSPAIAQPVFRRWLLEARGDALGRCDELGEAWTDAFPKHDFWSARLKLDSRRYVFDSERWYREIEADAAKRTKDPRTERLRHLIADQNISFERAYAELNDPRNRPTSQVVIESIIWSVKENGIAALKADYNIHRLGMCNIQARAEIRRRVTALQDERNAK